MLVLSALATPLVYALAGGFGQLSRYVEDVPQSVPPVDDIAQDFLEIALHNGQTTACFQLAISGLQDIAQSHGDTAAQEARQVLKARIMSVLRDEDRVFDAGVDAGIARFTILIAPGFRLKLDVLLDLAKRLRDKIDDPLSVAGCTRYVTASVGIASSLNFGRNVTAATWQKSALDALEEALASGGAATRVWSDKLARHQKARNDLHQDLAAALDAGPIQAFFQPQVSVRTGRVTGMEALARWDHPDRGWMAPAEFLTALSNAGHMDRLGHIMLQQSLDALLSWDRAGFEVPTVSINLSASELRNPDLAARIETELDRTGLAADRLVIEVLETVVSDPTDDTIQRVLHALSDLGCRIDLDDFGTGHASITTLQQFPINRVKIDRSFVRGADIADEKRRMLRAILAMTRQLDLESLGEGVETLGEHGVLRALDCGFAQGFLFAEPACARDISLWLTDREPQTDQPSGPQLRRVK